MTNLALRSGTLCLADSGQSTLAVEGPKPATLVSDIVYPPKAAGERSGSISLKAPSDST
jgi:hypothetical protein